MKYIYYDYIKGFFGRAPHGARGLKCYDLGEDFSIETSRPAWGAWIEIQKMKREGFTPAVAPRMGRVD